MRVIAFRQAVVSVIVAIALLWVLARWRLIDTRTLVDAAANAPGTLLILALLLLAPLVMGAVRYQAVLRAMGRQVPMSPIFAANAIGLAVASWLPASAGVMELMRFGLVVRSTRSGPAAVSKTALAVAALVDRLLGLATVALVGLLGGLYLLATAGAGRGGATWTIVALTLQLAAGCALPFVAVRVPRIERAFSRPWAVALAGILARLEAALREVDLRCSAFGVAVLASVVISATSILGMHLAMQLFAPSTPLPAVAVAFPSLTVAGVLPGNIAGFGGNQLAAAVVFGALGLDAKAAVLASLLVSAVSLVTTTVVGLVWAPRAWVHASGKVEPIRRRARQRL
jgi:uncharacterized membrane protein YbhN (UPF0104 family)